VDIIFFGSDKFAISFLEFLYHFSPHKLKAIITQPDKKGGRGLKFIRTPVKEWSDGKDILLLQPFDANNKNFIKELKEISADIYIVVSFGQILKKEILLLPKIFAINVHPSLLPKYRGAAPINWAIINGEKTTGITIIKMNENIDAGEIIIQKEFQIYPYDTAISLEERLSEEGVVILEQALVEIEDKTFELKPQTGYVSFAPRLNKKDGLIDWKQSAESIHNKVRGLQPWPSAYSFWNGKLIKIWQSDFVEDTKGIPGTVIGVKKDEILVACGEGTFVITEIQIEGAKRMKVKDFILGHKIRMGDRFGE
jgi:methionyl-tRNA formyltransferase